MCLHAERNNLRTWLSVRRDGTILKLDVEALLWKTVSSRKKSCDRFMMPTLYTGVFYTALFATKMATTSRHFRGLQPSLIQEEIRWKGKQIKKWHHVFLYAILDIVYNFQCSMLKLWSSSLVLLWHNNKPNNFAG